MIKLTARELRFINEATRKLVEELRGRLSDRSLPLPELSWQERKEYIENASIIFTSFLQHEITEAIEEEFDDE